jgi:hypothetical protein
LVIDGTLTILLFYFEKTSIAYLEGIFDLEIIKQDKCPKYNVSSILLFQTV